MKTLTVNHLLILCSVLVKDGKGDKKILVSDDDEGNGYHEAFYGFQEPSVLLSGKCPPILNGVTHSEAIKDYLILA